MSAVIDEICHPFHRLLTFSEDVVERFSVGSRCPSCRSPTPPSALVELGRPEWQRRVAVVQCPDCDLIYYRNPPDDSFIDEFYQSVWNQARGERVEGSIAPSSKVSRRMASLVADLGITDVQTRFLDVGCGIGALMAGLAEAGFTEVWGTEMSPYRVATTNARFPGRIYSGGYRAVPQGQVFDFIYANHVVEHFRDPADGLDVMLDRLAPGGHIVVTVPDAHREPVTQQVLFLPHLQSFSARSLVQFGARRNLHLSFWRRARPWELTAVYSREPFKAVVRSEMFATAGDSAYHVTVDQRERVRKPWSPTGTEQQRYLHLGQIHKKRGDQGTERGFVQLGAARAITAKFLRGINCSRLPYMRLSFQPTRDTIPMIWSADGNAPFFIK